MRAALQAIVACGGASAAGSNCGGAALGASTSVVLGNLLNQATGNATTTFIRNADGAQQPNTRSLEQQQAITQLIGTLAGVIATATGVDAPSAVVAATFEVENNDIGKPGSPIIIKGQPCLDTANVCSGINATYTSTNPVGVLALIAAEGSLNIYELCLSPANSASGFCQGVSARFDALVATFGAGLGTLTPDAIRSRMLQIEVSRSTLDQLFGGNEAQKDLVRKAIAQGHVPAGALEDILALKTKQDCDNSILCQTSQFVQNNNSFSTPTVNDPNKSPAPKKPDPGDKSYIAGLALAVLAGTTLPNPDDDDGYHDPSAAPSKQSAPPAPYTHPANVRAPAGTTNDGKQIYRDGYGNMWTEGPRGERVPVDAGGTPIPGFVKGIDYDKISTAKLGQSAAPRDLNEQLVWDQVKANPLMGGTIPGLNNDARFKASDGWQKMEYTYKLPDGKPITVHYQYNKNTGKAYDMKFTTPKPNPIQPRPSIGP